MDAKIYSVKKLLVLVLSFCFSCLSFANPQGGAVVGGNATISHPNANTMQINQTSNKAIINWRSFNIGAQEKVHFQQPQRSSIALNRVDPTQGASSIYGVLTANGQVWLINPAGISFGPGSYVNVGGLIATTANISNENFMAGNYKFVQSPDWNGAITNNGTIIANGGVIALFAPGVKNTGLVQADVGQVILASGSAYTIDFKGDGLINFSVDSKAIGQGVDPDGQPMKNRISNSGQISANGGKVMMTVKTASDIIDNTINTSGLVEAKTIANKNGEIILMADNDTVKVSGTLDASGKNPGETGGTIKVLGEKVQVADQAVIDAAGDQGGGQILIGGNAHGAGPELNATYTLIGRDTTIDASALTSGDGGTVIVWANQGTGFYGNIKAHGGAYSGDGGFVEVSGKENLAFDGMVNTLAPSGRVGTLLLDPRTITVVSIGGVATLADIDLFSLVPSIDLSINAATINAALSNVIMQANRDILFNTSVAVTGAGLSLTAQAARSITLASGVSVTTNDGDINFTANDSSSGASNANRTGAAGNITMNSGSSLNAGTGDISLTIDPTSTAPFNPGSITAVDLTGDAITINSPDALTLNGAISATGPITLSANTDGSGGNDFSMGASGSITTTDTSANAVNIAVNTAGGGTGTATLRAITTGSGGTVTVATDTGGNTTGGDILYGGTGSFDVGTGTITLTTPKTNNENIATSASPLQIKAGTLNATTGNSGIFITNTGTGTLTVNTLHSERADTGAKGAAQIISDTAIQQGNNPIATSTLTLKTLNDAGAAITFNDANNVATTINLQARNAADTTDAAGAISYRDSDGFAISGINTASTLDLTAGGSITQTGALTVSGIPTFTVTAANSDISLASQANDFGSTPVITDNGNIRDLLLRNINASASVPTLPTGMRDLTLTFDNASMTLPAVTLTDDLTATANGSITQSGALVVPGTTTLAAGAANDITLNNASNDFATVVITNADDVILRDLNALTLGASTISGALTVTADGAITDSGALAVTGLTSLDAGSANNITLNSAANNFSTVDIVSGRNVTLVDTNAIDIGPSTISGTFGLTSDGAVTQSGSITASGATTITAGAANDITLDSFANDFSTIRFVTVNNARVLDVNSLQLNASTISGNLDVTAGGTISEGGILNVTGTPTFTLTAANSDLSLASRANNFATTPVITSNGNVRDVLLRNVNAAADVPVLPTGLRNLTLTFDNAGIALPSVTLSGDLTATAGGAITQTGALSGIDLTALTTNDTAGAAPITLNSFTNEFNTIDLRTRDAADNANVATPITYTDATEFVIDALRTAGAVNLIGGGAITDSGSIIADTLTVNTTNGVVLNNAGHQITNFNVTNSGGGNIQLTDTIPLTITGFSQSGGGIVTFSDTGTLTIADGVAINSDNATLNITATDLDLSATGTLNSGTANTTITQNTAGGSIGLGNTAGTMTISPAELQRMSANNFTLIAPNNGMIIVDGITAADNVNISGSTILTATAGTLGSIAFQNAPSTFRALTANADDGITVGPGADITTSTGNLNLDADAGGGVGTSDALNLSANLSAAGIMDLEAQNGGIILNAPVSLTANDLTIQDAVNGAFNLTIDSGSGTASFLSTVGDTTPIGSGTGAALTLAGNDAIFEDTVTANSGMTANLPVTFENTVTLQNGDTGSTFNDLVTLTNASGLTFSGFDGLNFNAGLTTGTGAVTVNANNSGMVIGGSSNTFNSPISLAQTGQLMFDSGASVHALQGATFGSSNTDNLALTGPLSIFSHHHPMIFNATINGAQNLTLNAGSLGNITFNANLGNTTRLNALIIQAARNLTGNSTIRASSYISSGSGTTQFNSNTLQTLGTAQIAAQNLLGTINVQGLTINLSTGNFFGSIKGSTGLDAIIQIKVLNTLLPGRIFFNGIDIYSVFHPSIPAQLVFPTNYIFNQALYEQYQPEEDWDLDADMANPKKISNNCVSIGMNIYLCDLYANNSR